MRFRSWHLALALSGLTLLVLALLNQVAAPAVAQEAATSTIARSTEPVIVKLTTTGIPINQLFVYRAVNGSLEQIPFQIDEVTTSGTYTTTEDGLIDSNDEIVFMAKDLGGEATNDLIASLPISPTWYAVLATDPLSPTARGWAYIVRSATLTRSGVDYADFDAAARQVSTQSYTIGWATSHAGLETTSLFGGPDILDRTKLRASFSALGQTTFVTEENPLLLPPPPLVGVKDGPVRAIVRRGDATSLAYESAFETVTPVDLSALPSFVTILGVQVSNDLTPAATGGSYYDENTAAGVTIDGIGDTVATTPLNQPWRQVSLDSGSTILVYQVGNTGGTLFHYYKDSSTSDPQDTGDTQSFGDSGVGVTRPSARQISFRSVQYILPGRQPNRGVEFFGQFQNPLQLSVQAELNGVDVYVPLILR
jgi:hypothetical protein